MPKGSGGSYRSESTYRPQSSSRSDASYGSTSSYYGGSTRSVSSRSSYRPDYGTRSQPQYGSRQPDFRPYQSPMRQYLEPPTARPTQYSPSLSSSVPYSRTPNTTPSHTTNRDAPSSYSMTSYASTPSYSMSPRPTMTPAYTMRSSPTMAPTYTARPPPTRAHGHTACPVLAADPSYRALSRRTTITATSQQPGVYSDQYASQPSQRTRQRAVSVDVRHASSRGPTTSGGLPNTASNVSYSYNSDSEYPGSTVDYRSIHVSIRRGHLGRH
ncbi:hypothetical protein F4820DRAFT_49502 [Hypoxylon rubiginosum]|uniref:Uncharacterized protein n=1 Tax=Hypoxylon rubiginosum TaxID=110542 RepID=A0ACB9YQX7_9PEZI|nr:hypothetical protein F4820DRAFT_49502 [Hypoxylon rubiginosum]